MEKPFKPGRLKSLGIETKAQVTLYLPNKYVDLSNPLETISELEAHADNGEQVLVVGTLLHKPRYNSQANPLVHPFISR